jgi:Tfp pilus assembly protein PilF
MRPRLLVLAAPLLLAGCAPRALHERALEEVRRGYDYLGQGDLERAEVAFQHALEFNDEFPEALNGAGVVEQRHGRLASARRWFEASVKAGRDFAEGHNNLGVVLLAEGDRAAARERFQEALRVDPDFLDARLNLARALVEEGRLDAARRPEAFAEARRAYLHLLEARDDLYDAWHDLGFIAWHSGDPAGAAESYRRAVAVRPSSPEALHGLCISLVRLSRCAEAAGACRRCLEATPGSPRCQQSLRAALACGG